MRNNTASRADNRDNFEHAPVLAGWNDAMLGRPFTERYSQKEQQMNYETMRILAIAVKKHIGVRLATDVEDMAQLLYQHVIQRHTKQDDFPAPEFSKRRHALIQTDLDNELLARGLAVLASREERLY